MTGQQVEKFTSVEDIIEGLGTVSYIASREIATAILIAKSLEKPVLVGPVRNRPQRPQVLGDRRRLPSDLPELGREHAHAAGGEISDPLRRRVAIEQSQRVAVELDRPLAGHRRNAVLLEVGNEVGPSHAVAVGDRAGP